MRTGIASSDPEDKDATELGLEKARKKSEAILSETQARSDVFMVRRPRTTLGGLAYQVMNRVSGRQDLFKDAGDYEAFEWVLAEARKRARMRFNMGLAGLPGEEAGQKDGFAG